ncbi:MAG: NAD(P)H-hydrate dehydratase, partial [Acidiferrobacterales bacterium]
RTGTVPPSLQNAAIEALQALLERFGGVCVLTGAGTLIGESGRPGVWLCDAGNPGMASGGMGDVLTGALAALLAQGLAPLDAARIGVWVHAVAADDAAQQAGEVGLLASDLLPFIRRRLNQLARHAR